MDPGGVEQRANRCRDRDPVPLLVERSEQCERVGNRPQCSDFVVHDRLRIEVERNVERVKPPIPVAVQQQIVVADSEERSSKRRKN